MNRELGDRVRPGNSIAHQQRLSNGYQCNRKCTGITWTFFFTWIFATTLCRYFLQWILCSLYLYVCADVCLMIHVLWFLIGALFTMFHYKSLMNSYLIFAIFNETLLMRPASFLTFLTNHYEFYNGIINKINIKHNLILTLFIVTDVCVCVLSVGGNRSTRGKPHRSDWMTCQIALISFNNYIIQHENWISKHFNVALRQEQNIE